MSIDSRPVPAISLSASVLHTHVGPLMLDAMPDRPSAVTLPSTTYVRPFWWQDRSFTRQMGELFVEQPPEQRPDLVLVTEYSAIPIADAVRGFFSGLHESAPRISTIKANRDAFRKTEQNTIAGYRSRLRTRRETARLASDRVSYGHYLPCVIDQYVDSGRTMQYAFKLLQTAGYSAITAVNGQWYQQAELEPADIREVTSCFANELHAIGQQASERFTNKSVY